MLSACIYSFFVVLERFVPSILDSISNLSCTISTANVKGENAWTCPITIVIGVNTHVTVVVSVNIQLYWSSCRILQFIGGQGYITSLVSVVVPHTLVIRIVPHYTGS